MASGGRFNSLGLHVNTNVKRKDSTTFLLSPDLSASPQFSMSPTYSYAHCNGDFFNRSTELQRSLQNDSWQDRSTGSCAPLLATSHSCGGNLYLKGDSLVQSNFMYGTFGEA